MRRYYRHGKGAMACKQLGWEDDEFRALLVDTAVYKADFDSDSTLRSIPESAILAVSEPISGRVLKIDELYANAIRFAPVWKGKVGALVIYKHTGEMASSRLFSYSDECPGFPFEANGSVVIVAFDESHQDGFGKIGRI